MGPGPRAVRLVFGRVEDRCMVDVYDERSEELVTSDTLRNIAEWLDTLGFKWRVGSNGVWEKCR